MADLKNSKYTMEDIKKWAEEYKIVGSFREVGRKFGIDAKTISKLLKDTLNISSEYRYTIDDVRKMADRYNVLLSVRAVGREFDISSGTVDILFRRYKEQLGIKFKDEIEAELLLQGKKQCHKCKEIKNVIDFPTIGNKCLVCNRAYQSIRRNENREKYKYT